MVSVAPHNYTVPMCIPVLSLEKYHPIHGPGLVVLVVYRWHCNLNNLNHMIVLDPCTVGRTGVSIDPPGEMVNGSLRMFANVHDVKTTHLTYFNYFSHDSS